MGHLKPLNRRDIVFKHEVSGTSRPLSVAFADSEPEPTAAADPNADPWLYYGGYYGGLGHGYYGLGHYGYGLGGRYLWGRKKREADAEPTAVAAPSADAEADPWLYYGGLGHYGYGLGYPYYGYGLGARYVWGRKKRSAEAEPAAEAEADPWLYYGLGHYGGYYGRGYYGGYYGLGHRGYYYWG